MKANRIKELADQAEEQVRVTVKSDWGYLGFEIDEDEFRRVFAELIIAECAKLCEPAAQPEQEPDDNSLRLEFAEIPVHGLRINSRRHDNGKFIYGVEEDYQKWKQQRLALAQPEPVSEAYALADSVRQALDRQSCPGAFMDTAWESIVKEYRNKIYTSPPAREWVGLNDEEILKFGSTANISHDKTVCDVKFARAIEAKLKELNA
jgi:hypothetical protein